MPIHQHFLKKKTFFFFFTTESHYSQNTVLKSFHLSSPAFVYFHGLFSFEHTVTDFAWVVQTLREKAVLRMSDISYGSWKTPWMGSHNTLTTYLFFSNPDADRFMVIVDFNLQNAQPQWGAVEKLLSEDWKSPESERAIRLHV